MYLIKTRQLKKIWSYIRYIQAIMRIRIAYTYGRKVIKSKYGVLLSMNYGDRTFEFYVAGSYGYFYWDRLTNIQSEFLFLDIGANQGLYT